MPRISGVDIPAEKRIEIALTYIYGIGRSRSLAILESAKVSPDVRAKDLKQEELDRIREAIANNACQVEGELRRIVAFNIKRLKDINSYRGSRHAKGLPVYGQRTKTNARTKRGHRQSISGSSKRNVVAKK